VTLLTVRQFGIALKERLIIVDVLSHGRRPLLLRHERFQLFPQRLKPLYIVPACCFEIGGAFYVSVICQQFRMEAPEQVRQIMNMVGLQGASLGIARTSRGQHAFPQDLQDDVCDLVRTVHHCRFA